MGYILLGIPATVATFSTLIHAYKGSEEPILRGIGAFVVTFFIMFAWLANNYNAC